MSNGEGIDPTPGNRSYSEVDEVLESEKIDDEIEEQIVEEIIARQKKPNRLFSLFNKKT
jgi:hypothetical protein